MNQVTVLIPIGANPVYKQWVGEAIDSALGQTMPPGEILLIDDGAGITNQDMHNWFNKFPERLVRHDGFLRFDRHTWVWEEAPENRQIWISLWSTPWRIGFAQAFNCGVGISIYDNVIYLASDDKLMPSAVKDCMDAWEANAQKDAWYSLTYESATGGVAQIPINAAMITRNLWRWLGGYPPSAFAGPDALALSILMVHAPDRIIPVCPGKVNYWIREHPDQETHHQASFFLTEMGTIRTKETERFKPQEIVLR